MKHKSINVATFFIFFISTVLSISLKFHVFQLDVQGRHSWRQAQTCLNIRNFTRNDFNILNPRVGHYNDNQSNIKRMEFPFMQWLIAGTQKIFGESVLLIRSCMAIIYLFSCGGIFLLISFLFSSRILGSIGVFIFSFFPVYLYHSINPLPDNLGLCFAIYFLYWFLKGIKFENKKLVVISALFLAIAGLCKLPFILYGIFPLIYLASKNKSNNLIKTTFICFALTLSVTAFWYGLAIPNWDGNNIAVGVFDSSIGLKEYLEFFRLQLIDNIPKTVIGIPSVVLLTLSLFFIIKEKLFTTPYSKYFIGSGLIFTFYFFFILKQIREGHDYYFLPFLPLILVCIMVLIKHLKKLHFSFTVLVLFLLFLTPSISWNRIKNMWDIEQAYFNNDFFIYRNDLKSLVPNDQMAIMINDNSNYIVPYTIDKLGYVFMHNHLPINWISDLSENRNIKYLYSDSRSIENQEGFNHMIERKIGTFGSINVFRLH